MLFHKNDNIEYDDITNDNDDITNENYDMTNENDNMTNENDDDIIENFSSTCVDAKNIGCFAGGDNWWRNPLFCENPLTLGLNWHLVNKDIIDTGEYNEYVNPNLVQYIKKTNTNKIILNQVTNDSLGINRSDLTYKSYIKIDNGMYYIPTPENSLLCFIKRLFCMITVQKCDKQLLNETINQLTTAKNGLDTEVAKLNKDIESLSENLKTTEQSKQGIQSELDNLKVTHQTLIETKKTLDQTLIQVRTNLQTKTEDEIASDTQITALQNSLKTAESNLSSAEEGILDLQGEIEELNDEIDDLTKEKTTLTGRIGELERAATEQASEDIVQGQLFSSMWDGLTTSSPSTEMISNPPITPPPSPIPVEPECIMDCSKLEQKILSDYIKEYMGPDPTKNTGYNATDIKISNLGMSPDKKRGLCKIDYKWEKNPDHWPLNPGFGSGRRTYSFKLLNDDPNACEWNFDTNQNTGKYYTVAMNYGGELNYIQPPAPPPPAAPPPSAASPPPAAPPALAPASTEDGSGDGDNSDDDDWSDFDDFGEVREYDEYDAFRGSPSPPPASPPPPPPSAPASPPPPPPTPTLAPASGILTGNDESDLEALAALKSGNSEIKMNFG